MARLIIRVLENTIESFGYLASRNLGEREVSLLSSQSAWDPLRLNSYTIAYREA